uniref:glucose-6-phosphate 1-epimerase n=1 Tax=Hyaloperonospora arabidopsidis (strain Emoy2) TaxID=559515 RepID=M4BWV8_HYAAE
MTNAFFVKTAALVATLLASANAELETVKLKHPSGSTAEVYLFGAHVKSFRAAIDPNLDILFMSNESFLNGIDAIRGGIPIIYPNFGSQDKFPSHGFARITNWTLVSHEDAKDKKSPSVANFTMASSNSTRAIWPVEFELKYVVKLFEDQLETALHVHNTFDKAIDFHALLHNYLWVDDARNKGVQVAGLKGVDYFDKVVKTNKTETRELIDFAAQTDNVYRNAPNLISATIKGVNAIDRTVTVKKAGIITGGDIEEEDSEEVSGIYLESGNMSRIETWTDCVVWNPWEERAKTMKDFGDEEYKHMVAIEPGRVSEKQVLHADQTYMLQQTISVQALEKTQKGVV